MKPLLTADVVKRGRK